MQAPIALALFTDYTGAENGLLHLTGPWGQEVGGQVPLQASKLKLKLRT